MDDLKVWNTKAQADHIYAHFQTHMRTEIHALHQVIALAIEDSSIHMLKDVTEQMNQRSNELGNQLNAMMKVNFMEMFKLLKTETPNNKNAPPPQALNMQSPNTGMMAMIAAIQTKMDAITTHLSSTNLGTNIIDLNAADKNIKPKTGRTFKRYCWSCGCCVHWGMHYLVKKYSHKDDTRFKDRNSSSDKNCIPNHL